MPVADGGGPGPGLVHPPARQLRRLPINDDSRDQLPLYDAPHAAARQRHRRRHRAPTSCPRTSSRSAPTREEPTGRPGPDDPLRRVRRAHINGKTRADVAFGAGWVTARDRGLLLQLGPGPGPRRRRRRPRDRRVRARDERPVVRAERGDRGARHRADRISSSRPTATRAARSSPTRRPRPTASTPTGAANGIDQPPATVNDVIAVDRLHRVDLRRRRRRRGDERRAAGQAAERTRRGRVSEAWEDAMLVRRPRGADHDRSALRLRAAHRRRGDRARS